jgi:hypothetical protein
MSVEKMNFEKVIKENIPFTMVHTKVIQQITAHYLASAIWTYLLSLPPNWNVNKEHLKNMFKIGTGKLKEVMSFLKKCRLIEYVQERGQDGVLGKMAIRVLAGYDFVLIEENKLYTDMATGGTKAGRPVNRTTGPGTLQKIYNKNKTNKKENISCPSGDGRHIEKDHLYGFENFWTLYPRKEKKKRVAKIWAQNNLATIADKILAALQTRLDTEWRSKDLKFIPFPDTYLNQERWDDVLVDIVAAETRREKPQQDRLPNGSARDNPRPMIERSPYAGMRDWTEERLAREALQEAKRNHGCFSDKNSTECIEQGNVYAEEGNENRLHTPGLFNRNSARSGSVQKSTDYLLR